MEMTNGTEEVSVCEEEGVMRMMMPRGASCEAPPMHCSSSKSSNTTNTITADDDYRDDDDCSGSNVKVADSLLNTDEWVIATAAGNAAKAARGIRGLRTTNGKHPSALPQSVGSRNTSNVIEVLDEMKSEMTTGATSYVEQCIGMQSNVDDENGLYGKTASSEEEDGAYKINSSATLSHSVHIIQQEASQQNALIARIGLFLDKTWNWLHHLIVTIIFLNLFYAEKKESKSTETQRVISVDCSKGDEDDSGNKKTGESGPVEKSEKAAEKVEVNSDSVDNLQSGKGAADVEEMSPNTCSIQNSEVEKAQQAMMASEDKVDAAPSAPVAVETATSPPPSELIVVVDVPVPEPQVKIILSESEDNDANVESDEGIVVEMGVLTRRDSVDSYTSSEGSGNLGDTEDGSDLKIDNNSPTPEESEKVVAQKIISQVESMFSDEHLAKDGFLLKHVRRRSDGFVSLKLVAGLRKVKQISREFPTVLDALRLSDKLEINSEGTKVRRVEALTQFLKGVPIKSKEKTGKDKDNGSSNDENQQPTPALQQNNKSSSKSGQDKEMISNRRNSSAQQGSNVSNNGSQSRRNSSAHHQQNHRKSSNTSTASSNNSSRHNSFSKPPSTHPADLFRNVYTTMVCSSSGEESQSPQVGRRRGGSLPIAALQRASGAYLSPNSSPPNGNGAFITIGPNGARPKSNSYCEGASPTTMSPWLQRRKASASSRLSSGELVLSGVIRQPRGPDGTKGFASGYRAMILEERLQQQTNSAVSA